MFRRTFLELLPVTLLGGKAPKKSPVYTYDWSAQWTDDPEYQDGPLPVGPDVAVDGKDYSHRLIFRLRTGDDGYVEEWVKDEDGRFVEIENGTLKSVLTRGRVTIHFPLEVSRVA
jgi:hypothetical protein